MKTKILFIDDDPEQLDILTMAVQQYNLPCQTFTAKNGDSALSCYQQNKDIGLIICDSDLAGTGFVGEVGWGVYDRLQKQGYHGGFYDRSSSGFREEWSERNIEVIDKTAGLAYIVEKIQKYVGKKNE